MGLKNSDDCNFVETIEGNFKGQAKELFKRDYAKFIVKEEGHEDDESTDQVFKFVNNNIGKKLHIKIAG
ncbi:hypothetical protein Ddc_21927 [Ditylenchus destructor]|nr:hypothetical protein Ddc_21927 [Ditylenchus destructor]